MYPYPCLKLFHAPNITPLFDTSCQLSEINKKKLLKRSFLYRSNLSKGLFQHGKVADKQTLAIEIDQVFLLQLI